MEKCLSTSNQLFLQLTLRSLKIHFKKQVIEFSNTLFVTVYAMTPIYSMFLHFPFVPLCSIMSIVPLEYHDL